MKTKKHIVHVCEAFSYGAANSVTDLCNFFATEGHPVTLYYGERPGTEYFIENIRSNVKLVKLSKKAWLRHIINIHRIFIDLKKIKKAVLHGHSSYGGLYVKILSCISDTPAIYSPRGYAHLRKDKRKFQRKIYYLYEKLKHNRVQTVACGPSEQEEAIKLGHTNAALIQNFVKPRKNISTRHVGTYILSAGRICPQKGFDTAIEVARNHPQETFVWYGDADRKTYAEKFSPPKNFFVKKFATRPELLAQIASCKAVLLPSRWEGMSKLLIEARDLGKTVITSDIPANRDCVISGNNGNNASGFICSRLSDYSEAITTIKNYRSLKALQAKATVASHFATSEELYGKWKKVYNDAS